MFFVKTINSGRIIPNHMGMVDENEKGQCHMGSNNLDTQDYSHGGVG